MVMDPQEPTTNPQGRMDIDNNTPIEIFSQTQPPIQQPIKIFSQTQDRGTTKKAQLKEKLKGKNKATRNEGATTKWKPEVVPDPHMDTRALGLNGPPKRWPPHPSVEDVPDNGPPPRPTLPQVPIHRTEPHETAEPSETPLPDAPETDEESVLGKIPTTDAAELGLGPAEDIPIPLRGLWNYYYKHVPDEPTPAPSQILGWNPEADMTKTNIGADGNETNVRVIGKDTQESLDALDEILGKAENRRRKLREEEERRANEIRMQLEDTVRRQREGLDKEGKEIWARFKNPSPTQSLSPSPCLTPVDPRIIDNRFGTVSPPPQAARPTAPPMSPGGHHMGEGSERVSVISVKVTPGGKHAEAGSKRFTLPPGIHPPQAAQPPQTAQPALPLHSPEPQPVNGSQPSLFQQVSPALPLPLSTPPIANPALPRAPSSSGSSVPVVEVVPQEIKGPLPQHPVEVLGEKYASTTDAEGDTTMENATSPVSVVDLSTPPSDLVDLTTPPVTLP